jgi:hypothetical protein
VTACTDLRRSIAANPYIAEGPTGRTVLTEHLYWHASNAHGPEWAIDYLESASCDWTAEAIDFVDWVFNAAQVLKERAAWMALNEGLTYEWDAEHRAPYAQKSIAFINRITDTLSKKMVHKVKTGGETRFGRGIVKDLSGYDQLGNKMAGYRYPFGFICCQRQASRIISGRPRLAFQPSSRSALLGSE